MGYNPFKLVPFRLIFLLLLTDDRIQQHDGTTACRLMMHEAGSLLLFFIKAAMQDKSFADWSRACQDAKKGKPVNFDKLLAGYNATVDWPASAIWQELVKAYPGAKIILNEKDAEAW